jgi:WD40 repeat protein
MKVTVTSSTPVGVMRATAPEDRAVADAAERLLSANRLHRAADGGDREDLDYSIRNLVERQVAADQLGPVLDLLSSVQYLAARLVQGGMSELLADFARVLDRWPEGEAAELRPVRRSLELSTHVLERDPSQLPAQLLARLPAGLGLLPDRLRRRAEGYDPAALLQPLTTRLTGSNDPLQRTLEGHRGFVSAVAFSPDGKEIYSVGGDGVVRWACDGRLLGVPLIGPLDDDVTTLLATADGRWLIAGLRGGSLRAWPLRDGRPVKLAGHRGAVVGVAELPDGRILSGATDDRIRIWDLASGTEALNLPASADLAGVAIGAAGRRLVSVHDGQAVLWDVSTWQVQRSAAPDRAIHDGWPLERVAVSPDGSRVLVSANENMFLWDVAAGDEFVRLGAHRSRVQSLAITSDGLWGLSASSDETVKVWDFGRRACRQTLRGHRTMVSSVAASPAGEWVASGGSDQTVRLWRLSARTVEGDGHQGPVTDVCVAAGNARVVTASEDHSLKLWKPDGWTMEKTLTGHTHWVSAVAVTGDGTRAVSASWDGTLRIWSLPEGELLSTVVAPDQHVDDLVTDAMGHRAVTRSADGRLRVWDLAAGGPPVELAADVGDVRAILLNPAGTTFVAAGDRLTVWALEADGGRQLLSVPAAEAERTAPEDAPEWAAAARERVNALAWFPDGRRVLSGASDGWLRCWDVATGKLLGEAREGAGGVSAVAVLASGRVATCGGLPKISSDDTLRLWDWQAGTVLARWTGDCPFRCCAEGGDDTLLVGDEWGRLHALRYRN